LLAACGGDKGGNGGDTDGEQTPIEIETTPGCHPIAPVSCGYPFPNMMMLEEDAATPTGWRVNMTGEKLGLSRELPPGHEQLLELFNRADGFSPGFPILTQLGPQPVDRSLLPTLETAEGSLDPASPVQVFDMDTGERLPLWAETDLKTDDPARQSLMIRLQVAPIAGHTHLVVVTDALKAEGGDDLEPSDAYRALRDDIPTTSDVVEGMRTEYEGIFGFLDEHGVESATTVQAWRFVTHSDEYALSQAQPLVEDAVAAAADPGGFDCPTGATCDTPLAYTITSCETSDQTEAATLGCDYRDDMHPTVWRRVFGTFVVPSFQDPQTEYVDYENGRGVLRGTAEARFVMIVPTSLRGAAAGSAPTMVFGHGLLVLPEDYIDSPNDASGVQAVADQLGVVAIGTRWTGLSKVDEQTAIGAVGDVEKFRVLADRLRQAIVNFNLLVPLVHDQLASDPTLASQGGGSLVDPEHAVYYGISQGGIFGTTFMALSPHVKSGVLHVPTSMYSNVLQHSSEFSDFQLIIDSEYPDPIDGQLIVGYTQLIFDALEPANFARHLLTDPITAAGVKNCLWQINWGDKAAPDFNAFALGRSAGAPLVQPSTHPLFGFDDLSTPSPPNSSGLMIFDPGLGRAPLENDKGEDAPKAHQATRRNPEVRDQIEAFLAKGSQGTIDVFCGGEPCNIVPVPIPPNTTYP